MDWIGRRVLGVSFRDSEAGLGGFRGWRCARLGLAWGVGVRQLRCLARRGRFCGGVGREQGGSPGKGGWCGRRRWKAGAVLGGQPAGLAELWAAAGMGLSLRP